MKNQNTLLSFFQSVFPTIILNQLTISKAASHANKALESKSDIQYGNSDLCDPKQNLNQSSFKNLMVRINKFRQSAFDSFLRHLTKYKWKLSFLLFASSFFFFVQMSNTQIWLKKPAVTCSFDNMANDSLWTHSLLMISEVKAGCDQWDLQVTQRKAEGRNKPKGRLIGGINPRIGLVAVECKCFLKRAGRCCHGL